MANRLYCTGSFTIDNQPGQLAQLEGMFSFINMIDKSQSNTRISIWELNGRQKEYQKFLFYKHFFVHKKPLIITEGKTDVIYIKSALQSLYNDYPNLIQKNNNGTFEFKITFVKRTKCLNDFLGFSPYGASAMQNLYKNFYTDNNTKLNNYPRVLRKKSGSIPKKPIIFIFDNEMIHKDKPLYQFMNILSNKDRQLNKLKKDLIIRISEDGNLFLITNPLVNKKVECEIEDMFDQNTLNTVIRGKTFSRDSNYDINNYYGKDHFSEHIKNNWRSIDFSGFKPILDNINHIVTNYSVL